MAFTQTIMWGIIKGWHGIYDANNNDSSVNDTNITTWIEMARRNISRKVPMMPYTEFEDSVTVSAGDRDVVLPTGWRTFESLYYIDSDGNRKTIEWIPIKEEFDAMFPNITLQGTVYAATQWGVYMLLGLVPEEEITIYRSGRALVDSLGSSGTATDAMLVDLWDTIMWGTLIVSAEYATVPENKQNEWKQHYLDDIELLRKQYKNAKIPPGRLVSMAPGYVAPVPEE